MKLGRLAVALALSVAACGGDDDGGGGADGGPPDGGSVSSETSECGASGPARAVVAAVNGETDFVQVLAFADGTLGTGPTFEVNNPRGVAMRADGREAAIAYGFGGDPVGVLVLSIEEGGTGAEVVDDVELGTGQTSWAIAYASDDHIVLVTAGPDVGTIEAIDRDGDGFTAGATTEIPDNWPLEVASRPGHDEVILLRANLAEDDASDVQRLARDGDSWAVSGAVGQIGPPSLDVAVHGGGGLVYGSASDPEDPVSTANLDAQGVLHVLSVDDGGVAAETTIATPGLSSYTAIAPMDRFLVLPVANYEEDPKTSTPIVRSYRLVTVPLDDAGMPQAPLDDAPSFDGLLSYDLDVTASGHLLHAMEMYAGTVPPGEESPLLVWAHPSPGVWEECDRVHLGGAVELAVAP